MFVSFFEKRTFSLSSDVYRPPILMYVIYVPSLPSSAAEKFDFQGEQLDCESNIFTPLSGTLQGRFERIAGLEDC